MESLKGTQKNLTMDVGDGAGGREIDVDVPAGVEHGQQLLIQDVVRTNTTRVNLVVQVPFPTTLVYPSWQELSTTCTATQSCSSTCICYLLITDRVSPASVCFK